MYWDITGRPVIVTGGNSGIGLATATALAAAGADVTITVRSHDRGIEAANRIAADTGRRVDIGIVDLAGRRSIRSFAEAYLSGHDQLAVLVNNAGGVFGRRALTEDGFERTFATNHLGPFELTAFLTPMLVASAPARVINVASSGHGFASEGIPFDDLTYDGGYSMRTAYGVSKLANILHAREFDARYGTEGVHAFAMHPGLVRTRIGRDGDSLLAAIAWFATSWRQRTPAEGADTVVWLATADPAPTPTGGYFEDRQEARSTRWARSDEQAVRLWEASERLLATTDPAEEAP